MSSFLGLSWELLENEVLKLHWILNFILVIDISGWLCSLQFLSVTLSVMEIKPILFYQMVKNLGRPRPLRVNQVTESGLRNTRPSCIVSDIWGSPWKKGFSPSEKSNNIILISLLFSDKILVTVSKILLYSKLELYKLYEHYRLRKFQNFR